VAARFKAGLLGLEVRIPPGDAYLSLVSDVCYQVEVTATGRSLVQGSTIERVCVCVCVSISVIKGNNLFAYNEYV